MKYLKIFEDYNIQDSYVTSGDDYDGVIFAYEDDIVDMSPLHYVWSEYPKYKEFNQNSRLKYSYNYYADNKGNKYFIYGSCGRQELNVVEDEEELDYKIKMKADWYYARNVDDFVEGADKEEYERWKDLIS